MKFSLKLGLLIVWMGVIFYFSHQTGSESSESSKLVIMLLEFLGIDVNSLFGDISHYIIRKTAHFTEYFILSFLFFNVYKDFLKYKYFLSIFSSFVYACSDEFHQIFVESRSASFIDVLIDTLGAVVAMCLIYFIISIRNRKKLNNN